MPSRGTSRASSAAVLLSAGALAAQAALSAPASAEPVVTADPAVVGEWSAIATRTIYAENGTPAPVGSLYLAFASLAVYDAVVAVKGRYAPYTQLPRPHAHASAEVAAATAAHSVLRHYFPASAARLDEDYAASLARTPRGVGREHGERVGRDAADAMIAARADDGRGAPGRFDGGTGPGAWRPTGTGTMLAPWLGNVRPLLLSSSRQFPFPGPDPLPSARYAADFAEARDFGRRDGSARTAEQTSAAQFWSGNPMPLYQAAMADQVAKRGLDLVDAARAFALMSSAVADSLVSCWRAKVDFPFWRPVTAIAEAAADGNPATEAEPGWTSLFASPPYPDYPSGHACVSGATSGSLAALWGEHGPDLVVGSGPSVRVYPTLAALDQETMGARIWMGIHFRKAMTDGNRLGHVVAAHLAATRFRPVA